MKVGDLVGYINGDGPMGLVLDLWLETQPGIGVTETWYEVLWCDGGVSEVWENELEKIYESR